ncbi:pre-rRNA-processing protein esf1 [Steccherinum ochraceum]|uniref:Pre-rRNA-processing protein esf1 n=1 Tax=Steccherinum ochraceum TaxID=92696 RepID=A0A4R0RRU2_9APHY|nr:pre-rRNA-processing protein esf1 [Steccherinum ochraceum]
MSDPRFARLKSDPRFRRIRKQDSKVVVDDRFKGVFQSGGKKKSKHTKGRVDKYGRPLADTHEEDNLRRFYRLENEDEEESAPKGPDYARGAVLMESSDEEDGDDKKDDSDDDGVVVLGRDISKPIPVPEEDEAEIDLDESQFADLDAQAEAYAKQQAENEEEEDEDTTEHTRRLAVVNLDWDHVRAVHLYKIFSSLVSPTAPPAASSSQKKSSNPKDAKSQVARGRVLSVRVYPSQFGKERMAREEVEGPPPEIFTGAQIENEEDVNEITVYETGDGQDYNEDALRKYQLERLRYYYAIVECDTVAAASHIYRELDGTELERSANVFDLSFVPDGMSFDEEPRDDATDDLSVPYKNLEFVTDALRHSKVKLTWDDDDPERNQITRRTLSRKEIDENDFRAYIASSESEDEGDAASRDKLRALLLSGGDDTLPEGWGQGEDGVGGGADMEITFTPGLSETKNVEDETTLDAYRRKMREKKKKRKEERTEKTVEKKGEEEEGALAGDDFFAAGSGAESDDEEEKPRLKSKDKKKSKKTREEPSEPATRRPSTAEELALIAASDNPDKDPKHFDMKAIVKAEKAKGKKRKQKKGKAAEQAENETQDDFKIDVQDDRFKALHEDHTFAIDPSNPRFKKTKSMSALLDERSKQQRGQKPRESVASTSKGSGSRDLQSLVESVKRKSSNLEQPGVGKRRKL